MNIVMSAPDFGALCCFFFCGKTLFIIIKSILILDIMAKYRLTENKLRTIIREAVKNQINEISAGLAQNAANKAYSMGREGYNQYDEPNTIPAGSPHWKKFMQGERFQKYVNNIFDYDKGNYIYYPNGDGSLMVVRNANGEDLTKPCTSLNDLEREYKSVKMHESKLRNTIQEAVKSVINEETGYDEMVRRNQEVSQKTQEIL